MFTLAKISIINRLLLLLGRRSAETHEPLVVRWLSQFVFVWTNDDHKQSLKYISASKQVGFTREQ